jgi:hypothetical protein
MKKLIYLLLIAFSLFSCSKDEIASKTIITPQVQQKVITLNINNNIVVDNITIIILSNSNNILHTYSYDNIKDVILPISDGNKVNISITDNIPVQCNYRILNENNTLQLQNAFQGCLTCSNTENYIVQ